MHLVTPKVFFLGEMTFHRSADNGVEAWLSHIGGREAVACLDHITGSDLEQLVELLARRCYKSFAPGLNPNVTKIRTESAGYHANIAKQRHGSVTAHGHCTYAFEDVSRVFTHEVVRNSTGNDISQESLRYVRLDDIGFWIPSIIVNATVRDSATGQTAMQVMMNGIIDSERRYKQLCTMFDIDNIKDFETKKLLTSAFRRVAPEGLATGIVMTFQIRSLRWIIEQRTSRHSEEEIRIVMNQVAEHAIKQWPYMFQDFQKVDTNDGLFEYVPTYSKI